MDKVKNVFEKIALTDTQETTLIGGGVGAALTAPSYMKTKPEQLKELKNLIKYRDLSAAHRVGKTITSRDMKFVNNLLKKYKNTSEIKKILLPAKLLKPESIVARRAMKLESLIGSQKLPLHMKGLRSLGKGAQTALMALGFSALLKNASLQEGDIEKYAALWTNIAKGITGYGKNIVRDFKMVGKGYRSADTAVAARAKKGLSNKRRLATYQLEERGQKQMLQGLKGLGMRVGVPAALTYTTLT